MDRSSEAWADQDRMGAAAPGVNQGAPRAAKPRRGIATLQALRERCTQDARTHCWLWQGACSGGGMPHIWSFDYARMDKRALPGPVVAWQLAHDRAVPAGKMVFRGCGRKLCLNPVHLRLAGSRSELMAHVARAGWLKGRGLEQHRAALVKARAAAGIVPTGADVVRQIREAPREVTNLALAARLGISHWTVSNIRRGRTRGAVAGGCDAAGR